MVKRSDKKKQVPRRGSLMSKEAFDKYRFEVSEGLRESIRQEGINRALGYVHAGKYVLDYLNCERNYQYE